MEELARMTEQLKIDERARRRAKTSGDMEMDGGKSPQIQVKSKGIKKNKKDTKRFKKSRK